MRARTYKNNRRIQREGGFSLAVALLFVFLIGTFVMMNLNMDAQRRERERAVQSAWLVAQISEAARLFVRDNSVVPGVWARENLCTAPREILVADLIPRYLSPNIGQRRDAGGTRFVTPLDQTVRIMAANSVINSAACTPAQLAGIATTAYVLLEPGARTNLSNLMLLSESLAAENLPIIPARFDAAGTNISPGCSGGAAGTIQWDTGCLTPAQYSFLHPSGPFAQGHFGLPVWLSFRGDNRAIFRYPQPENPQAQQMTTDLRMASAPDLNPATCVQEQIRTAQVAADPRAFSDVASGVCQVNNDSAITDSRHDIHNISNITLDRALISPQTIDFGGPDVNNPARITGNLSVGSAATGGDARAFNLNNATPGVGLVTGNVTLANNAGLAVAQGMASAPTLRVNGNFAATDLQANSGTVNQHTGVAGPTSVTTGFNNTGDLTINGGRGLVVGQLSGRASSLNVAGNATVAGVTATPTTGTTTIASGGNGGAALSLATARLDGGSIDVGNSNIAVGGDFSTSGGASIPVVTSVGTCFGDCPDRAVITPPL